MLRRGGLSIAEVRDSTGRENLIVVTTEQVRLVAGGSVFWFHPNMARSRIEAMLRSEYDRLVEFAGVTTGDRVFDATGGLGSDAIVFAHAAGQSGHVCAVERSEILSAIVRHGSRYYEHRNREVIKAMRRVMFTCDDSSELLKTEA
ncbi:MAG TPA: SAM-dependent methyltransferase, partial [Candidatus Latescibacteria bacterium]|nr:SAM-dependent methyltransferase [Candidatus Latescibacterota bacterium]